jgi:thiazole synthase
MRPKTTSADTLVIADRVFRSRLFLGTARYASSQLMLDAVAASGTEMVTAAIRRVIPGGEEENMVEQLAGRVHFLPNTAGCFTAKDAILTAELAREALETNWIKLEVIGDRDLLYPDVEGTLRATEELVAQGFVVLAYCNEDPVTCRKLEEAGAAAVMPLGAPIGSGLGIQNPNNIRIIRQFARVPVIVDAGVGTASDAALAMELGADGVLMNTAIAGAKDPVAMAMAMKLAIESGRLAFKAGRIQKKLYATASSPIEGVPDWSTS